MKDCGIRKGNTVLRAHVEDGIHLEIRPSVAVPRASLLGGKVYEQKVELFIIHPISDEIFMN